MLATEDFVDVVAVAANLRGKPRWAAPLAFHSAFNDFTDMYGVDDFHKKSVNRFALNAYYLAEVPLPLYLISTKRPTQSSVNHSLLIPIHLFRVIRQAEQERKALYVNN